MGRATITGGGTSGLYTIEVDIGDSQQAAMVANLNAAIVQVDANIVSAQLNVTQANAIAAVDREELSAAVEAYVLATQIGNDAGIATALRAHEAALAESTRSSITAAQLETNLRGLQLYKLSLAMKLNYVSGIETSLARSVWCVDLTEDATGQVATIEIPGEPETILIQASGAPPTTSDGALLAREVMTPEQAYLNAAMLPGWQRWMPTYRTGVISAVDYDTDTATVTLEAATSSAQSLNVNRDLLGVSQQTPELVTVPVTYMTCNSWAFDDGDAVVVMFPTRDWSDPRIIGFVSNPKSCNRWSGWSMDSGHYVRRSPDSAYLWRAGMGGRGNISWTGTGQSGPQVVTVSWKGRVGKHLGKLIDPTTQSVYMGANEYYFPLTVHGAFADYEDGRWWIYALCRNHSATAPEVLYKVREDDVLDVSAAVVVTSWSGTVFHPGAGFAINTERNNYESVFWNADASAAVGMVGTIYDSTWPNLIVRYTREGAREFDVSAVETNDGFGNEYKRAVLGVEYVGGVEKQCVVEWNLYTEWTLGGLGPFVAEGSGTVTIGDSETINFACSTSGMTEAVGTGEMVRLFAVDISSGTASYVFTTTTYGGGTIAEDHEIYVFGQMDATSSQSSAGFVYYGSCSAIGVGGYVLNAQSSPTASTASFIGAYGKEGEYIAQYRTPVAGSGPSGLPFVFSGAYLWGGNSVSQESIVADGGTAMPYGAIGVV